MDKDASRRATGRVTTRLAEETDGEEEVEAERGVSARPGARSPRERSSSEPGKSEGSGRLIPCCSCDPCAGAAKRRRRKKKAGRWWVREKQWECVVGVNRCSTR